MEHKEDQATAGGQEEPWFKLTTEDELNAEKKQSIPYPDYMQVKYTDYNPIEISVSQGDKEIRLMNYRYAVPDGVERKGAVFYIHGYGSYCEHRAFIFKTFAEQGYESFALDQRGFGNSEGTRAYFGSSSILYNDLYLFIYKAIMKYDLKKTPIFLIGTSFGSLIAFNMAIRYQNIFAGMAIITPFFRAVDTRLYLLQFLLKSLNFLYPKAMIRGNKSNYIEFYEKYQYVFEDPKSHTTAGRVQTTVMFPQMQEYARQNIEKAKTPYILITVKDDTIVNNAVTMEIFNKINNPLNKHVEFDDTDHLRLFVEEEEVKRLIKTCIEYFDTIVEQRTTIQ